MKPYRHFFLSGFAAIVLNSCGASLALTRTTAWDAWKEECKEGSEYAGGGKEGCRFEYEELQSFDRGYTSYEKFLLALKDMDTGLRRTKRLFDVNGDKKWDMEQLWTYDEEGNLLESTVDYGCDGTIDERLTVSYITLPQPREDRVYTFGESIEINRTETKYPSKETLLFYDELGNITSQMSNCYQEINPYTQKEKTSSPPLKKMIIPEFILSTEKTKIYLPDTGEIVACGKEGS